MDAFLRACWRLEERVVIERSLALSFFTARRPSKLVAGRERIYFEHFWNDFAADPKHSVAEAIAGSMRRLMRNRVVCAPASEVFRAFEQDAKDFAQFAADQADDANAGISG